MKKTNITITYDEEKLNAIRVHFALKDLDLDKELTGVLDTLFRKYVPTSVRNYIELKDAAIPKKAVHKSTPQEVQKRGDSE